MQSLKQLPFGKTFQGGDYHQVGGEFMFEPASGELYTPVASPEEEDKQIGNGVKKGVEGMLEGGYSEEKRVTWCHRMRNTRDHAEMEELREVLGLDPVVDQKKERRRSRKPERKGTGFSLGSRSSTGFSKKVKEVEDGGSSGSSGRGSSEKDMDATHMVR